MRFKKNKFKVVNRDTGPFFRFSRLKYGIDKNKIFSAYSICTLNVQKMPKKVKFFETFPEILFLSNRTKIL